ncbi:hypothetical protein C1646_262429 [Rhizophagus diaphanus]|nr:hypothetical protein C1646_262429 [Rhizophagus diaphanus] [Rhizophagus sp. MUCL 43196]
MSSQRKDERIVLNIGGIKYETYRSTLTAYPDTLLGTMFQERNEELLKPNENEYFFDRNDTYILRYMDIHTYSNIIKNIIYHFQILGSGGQYRV